MRVLIVAKDTRLATIWSRHLSRIGCSVSMAETHDDAVNYLCDCEVDIIILNTRLKEDQSPMAVADFAAYRQPDAKIIFVSNSRFFSDGSLFQHFTNACAVTPPEVSPDDLGALVEYHGVRGAA